MSPPKLQTDGFAQSIFCNSIMNGGSDGRKGRDGLRQRKDGRQDGRMDGGMDGRMDERMDACICHTCISTCV